MLAEVKTLQRTEKNTITLVIDSDTGTRYIRKELCGPHPIYAQLQALSHLYLPKIFHVEETRTGVVLIEGFIDGANLAEITLPEKQVILLFLGIADGNIEDQRLEQIHFGAVPEVIAFLATGILDDDVTKTSRIRYKTDNPEALICLLSGRPPVRVWSGVPKCVDERCNAENAARKCGVFTYNAPLLE